MKKTRIMCLDNFRGPATRDQAFKGMEYIADYITEVLDGKAVVRVERSNPEEMPWLFNFSVE